MNAYAAAAANGRESELDAELDALFNEQNTSAADSTSIPATFLRVTVKCMRFEPGNPPDSARVSVQGTFRNAGRSETSLRAALAPPTWG